MRQSVISLTARGSIGLLVGLLTGYSSSPVVATVLGILATLIAALFYGSASAQDEKTSGNGSPMRPRDGDVAAFGLLCIFGVITGIFGRTHAVLAESPQAIYERWNSMLDNEAEAKQIAVFELTGLTFSDTGSATPSNQTGPLAPILKANDARNDTCVTLRTYVATPPSPFSEELKSIKNLHVAWYDRFVAWLQTQPPAQRPALTEAAIRAVCNYRE